VPGSAVMEGAWRSPVLWHRFLPMLSRTCPTSNWQCVRPTRCRFRFTSRCRVSRGLFCLGIGSGTVGKSDVHALESARHVQSWAMSGRAGNCSPFRLLTRRRLARCRRSKTHERLVRYATLVKISRRESGGARYYRPMNCFYFEITAATLSSDGFTMRILSLIIANL
jgi:hypothetical protein